MFLLPSTVPGCWSTASIPLRQIPHCPCCLTWMGVVTIFSQPVHLPSLPVFHRCRTDRGVACGWAVYALWKIPHLLPALELKGWDDPNQFTSMAVVRIGHISPHFETISNSVFLVPGGRYPDMSSGVPTSCCPESASLPKAYLPSWRANSCRWWYRATLLPLR